MSKVLEYTRKGIWALGVSNIFNITFHFLINLYFIKQGLGMTSCLARNDFNVAFSIITLMLLTNFYNQNPKATTKIIIQMITVLILADIVWIILFSTAWEHNTESKEKFKISVDNQFWDSLWLVHKMVYILAYIELILKAFLLYYLIADFKEKYRFKDLFSFNYDDERKGYPSKNIDGKQINFDNSLNNYVNESNNSYVEDFRNKY